MAVPHAGDILERRLTDIGNSLLTDSEGLGLLALGSVGVETARRDAWSDLDFFAIVQPGSKPRWLADIAWLEAVAPVAWSFENTKDGRKLLFADGVYAEYAVFTPDELAGAAFAEGRWIVRRAELPDGLRVTTNDSGRIRPRADTTWSAGELVSCLYVGLCRFHRGEQLSAWRFVQTFCLDRWQELVEQLEPVSEALADPYGRDRRFEARWPNAAAMLPRLIRGLEETPAAALAYLEWLEARNLAPPAMSSEIRRLAGSVYPLEPWLP
ncbi:MAG: hypothetical protein KBC36_03890 [Spirochaetia bacterium]|nr:hypothetical protein [Spirochaetia bacterium]